VIDNVLDGLAHSLTVAHVDAIEADVDSGLLTELTRSLVTELLLDVHNGNTTDADLGEGLSHVVSETTTTTEEIVLARAAKE
jgi:hypothetical protein